MSIKLTKNETQGAIPSIQRYFKEEFEIEITEMRAGFVLDYFLKEIGPFAYNNGVRDAEKFFREKLEDLPGTCWEDELTYWHQKKK
jgi:uncharacterized protein (DUF2164 family)